jgi:uncharacterized repeat protein (TIGR01451 family)
MVIIGVATLLPPGAEPAAAQGRRPYISPRVQPRSVKADPARLKPVPAPGRKTVPEGETLPAVPPPPKRQAPDPAIQLRGMDASDAPGPDALGAPVVNVPGITSNAFPPDTVGDIGRNHYVQMTNAPSNNSNTVFQIFDKLGNDLSGGPLRFGGLWPVGDPCDSDRGDPIVVYDHLADRWNLSQFAQNAAQTQFWMCVAISQTPNPVANTWFLYTIEMPADPDYPKFGVWPDGYYMSSFEGSDLGVFVFDRTAMITGAAAGFMKDTIPSLGTASIRGTRILPADLDGLPPPPGTPNFFVRTVDDQQDPGNPVDRIEMYEFVTNWTTNTFSFNPLLTISGAALVPFDVMTCDRTGGGSRDCIPQPDTASTVDSLSTRPMMQLKYRRFGTQDAMVFNQTIDVSGSINAVLGFVPADEVAGIRWYDLRRDGGAWSILQQGTYAPQPIGATTEAQLVHRWMGSMAIDKDGNIALGYSVANDDDTNGQEIFPGIRYSGRRFDDLLGQFGQTERVILNGTLSETGGAGQRWGDYSAMSVDPVDDCTFYYTTHVATGATGKPTRIAAFRFDTCGTDLRITKTDKPDPVAAGELLRYDITVTNLGANPAEGVVVTDTLPAGVTYVSDTIGCTVVAQTLTCDLGDIAPGASSSFSIHVRVSSSAIVDGITTLTNQATVTALTGDPNPLNNTATASTLVVERADLRVLKTCKPDAAAPAGTTGHCEIQVDNLGPSDARSVSLVDAITSSVPFTVTAVIVTPSGACAPAAPIGPTTGVVLTCDLLTMVAGTRKTVRVEFSSSDQGDVNDVATVSSATPDPDPGNNEATGHVNFAGSADLLITKSGPASVMLGADFTYTLSVDNLGPSTASSVVVTDVLSPGVAFVSAVASVGTFNAVGEVITWSLGTVAVADPVRTLEVTVHVLPQTPAAIVNNASVSSATLDPNSANNLASLTTTVVGTDLWIAKSGIVSAGNPASALTYSITVFNAPGFVADSTPTSGTGGPNDALNVVVIDTLPLDSKKMIVQFLSPNCTYDATAHQVTCTTATLTAGTSVTFEIQVQIKGSVGNITNVATVSSTTPDPNLANNTDTVNNVVQGGTGKKPK